MEFAPFLKYFVTLLVITNPIAAIPIFLGLTEGQGIIQRKATARSAAIAVVVILLIVTWGGFPILRFFGIQVPAFQVAGGIIIFSMGLSMLNSKLSPMKHSKKDHDAAKEEESVGIVPLAIPLLAGPGAISTVIVHMQAVTDTLVLIGYSVSTVFIGLVLFICLRNSDRIASRIGETGIRVTTRIMGMVLAAIAIEMLSVGLKGLFPSLA